jgi:hypothetical protein
LYRCRASESYHWYEEFRRLACESYNVLRKHSSLLTTLFSLMLSCGIPQLQTEQDLDWLEKTLIPGVSDEEAAKHFGELIDQALKTRMTQYNDAFHVFRHAE